MLARARAVASSLWVMGRGPAAPLYPREAGRELAVLLEGVDLALWRREAPRIRHSPWVRSPSCLLQKAILITQTWPPKGL